jgi:hypothetical protein
MFSMPAHVWFFLFFLSLSAQFRGGRQARRDRWYGLEDEPDFHEFRRWWHRRGKDAAGGTDLKSRKEALYAYDTWVNQRRPRVK